MAQLNQNFNAENVAPAAPMEIVPAGDYLAQIVKSEMRDTKNSGGQYLWLEIAILEGQYQERRLFDRLNLVSSSLEAQQIAERTLSAICHATGQMQVADSDQLHFKPLIVTVRVRPAGPDKSGVQREAQNEIRGYKARSGAIIAPRTTTPAQTAVPATTKTGAAPPPWKRSPAA